MHLVERLENASPIFRGVNFGPLLIFVAATLWATDTWFRPEVLAYMSASELVWWEHLVIVLLFVPFVARYGAAFASGRRRLDARGIAALLFVGVGGSALGTVFLTEGYARGHVAVVALLQQSQPLVAFVGAKVLLGETHRWRVYLPLAAGALLGVFFIFWPFLRITGAGTGKGIEAGIFALLAAVCWGGSTVLGRMLLSRPHVVLGPGSGAAAASTPSEAPGQPAGRDTMRPLELATYRFTIAFLFLSVYSHVKECYAGVWVHASVLPNIAAIAVLTGVVSLLLFYIGLRHTPASVSTLMELAYPLWLLALVPVIRSEPLETEQVLGAVLLVACAAALNLYTSHPQPRPEPASPAGAAVTLTAKSGGAAGLAAV